MLTNIFTTFIVASSFGAFSLTVLSSHRPPYISLSHFFKTIKFDETSNSNDWKQCFSKCAPLQGIHWIGLTEFHIVKSFHWNGFLPERPHKRLHLEKRASAWHLLKPSDFKNNFQFYWNSVRTFSTSATVDKRSARWLTLLFLSLFFGLGQFSIKTFFC